MRDDLGDTTDTVAKNHFLRRVPIDGSEILKQIEDLLQRETDLLIGIGPQ